MAINFILCRPFELEFLVDLIRAKAIANMLGSEQGLWP